MTSFISIKVLTDWEPGALEIKYDAINKMRL